MKLKAGMILECTTHKYNCLTKGQQYKVWEYARNDYVITCTHPGEKHFLQNDYLDYFKVVAEQDKEGVGE